MAEPPPDEAHPPADEAESAPSDDASASRTGEVEFSVHADSLTAAGWNGFDTLLPIILFLVFNQTMGLGWAIAATSLGSLWAAYNRVRRGMGIGWLLPLVTLFVLARGVLGILTDSEAVYFGIGIGAKYAGGLACLVAAFLPRDLWCRLIRKVLVIERSVVEHPQFVGTLKMLVFAAGIYYLATASFDLWLFQNSGTNEYVVVRFVVNWVVGMICTLAAFAFLAVRLNRIPGFPGLLPLVEAQLVARNRPRS